MKSRSSMKKGGAIKRIVMIIICLVVVIVCAAIFWRFAYGQSTSNCLMRVTEKEQTDSGYEIIATSESDSELTVTVEIDETTYDRIAVNNNVIIAITTQKDEIVKTEFIKILN